MQLKQFSVLLSNGSLPRLCPSILSNREMLAGSAGLSAALVKASLLPL